MSFFIKARTNPATLKYSLTLKPVIVSYESNYNLHMVNDVNVCLKKCPKNIAIQRFHFIKGGFIYISIFVVAF